MQPGVDGRPEQRPHSARGRRSSDSSATAGKVDTPQDFSMSHGKRAFLDQGKVVKRAIESGTESPLIDS